MSFLHLSKKAYTYNKSNNASLTIEEHIMKFLIYSILFAAACYSSYSYTITPTPHKKADLKLKEVNVLAGAAALVQVYCIIYTALEASIAFGQLKSSKEHIQSQAKQTLIFDSLAFSVFGYLLYWNTKK